MLLLQGVQMQHCSDGKLYDLSKNRPEVTKKSALTSAKTWTLKLASTVDTVQDFLIKLGIKPRLHILKISIFSLNHVIVRPTKIIKDLCKAST